jgi:hypothetical protein
LRKDWRERGCSKLLYISRGCNYKTVLRAVTGNKLHCHWFDCDNSSTVHGTAVLGSFVQDQFCCTVDFKFNNSSNSGIVIIMDPNNKCTSSSTSSNSSSSSSSSIMYCY